MRYRDYSPIQLNVGKRKSENMFNKTKSSDPDLYFITQSLHKLDLLLKEQVNQRKDLSVINHLLKTMIADFGVQKQVDDYYDGDEEIKPETSPQTDTGEQR